MPDFSTIKGGSRCIDHGMATATSSMTVLPNAVATNAKDEWVQLVSSTPRFYDGVIVYMYSPTNKSHLVDIGIGPALGEKVILPNLLIAGQRGMVALPFPIKIPKGVRIAARHQCDSIGSGDTMNVGVQGITSGLLPSEPLSAVDAYGANLATSRGVALDAGGSSNTKAGYVQIVGATTHDIKAFVLSIGTGAVSKANATFLLDIGVGLTGFDIAKAKNIFFSSLSSDNVGHEGCVYNISIPKGSRISGNIQSSTSANNSRLVDIVIYGVR